MGRGTKVNGENIRGTGSAFTPMPTARATRCVSAGTGFFGKILSIYACALLGALQGEFQKGLMHGADRSSVSLALRNLLETGLGVCQDLAFLPRQLMGGGMRAGGSTMLQVVSVSK